MKLIYEEKSEEEEKEEGEVGGLGENLASFKKKKHHSCFLETSSMQCERSEKPVEDPGHSSMQNIRKLIYILWFVYVDLLF